MEYKARYSIGEMSRICNISKKALRYYDQIDLITSKRQDYNNYRYYTLDSLLTVPIIKFYKQMGFKLDEMKTFIEGEEANIYTSIEQSFRAKIKELEQEQEELRRKHASVKDWRELIVEAKTVIKNNINEVSVKYIEPVDLLYLDQHFDNNIEAAIINIDFTNHVEKVENEITGPVIIKFSSHKKRMYKTDQRIRVLQKTLIPCKEEETKQMGGCMVASCYHIGPHEEIEATYRKISRWAKQNDYILGKESYERYVTDYWTTKKRTKFVTEVMIPATRRDSDLQR